MNVTQLTVVVAAADRARASEAACKRKECDVSSLVVGGRGTLTLILHILASGAESVSSKGTILYRYVFSAITEVSRNPEMPAASTAITSPSRLTPYRAMLE